MESLQILQTNSEDAVFRQLAEELEAELKIRDGKDHVFYATLNQIGFLPHCLVVFSKKEAIACGALRQFDEHIAEMKRVYVRPAYRGQGIAGILLAHLEKQAVNLGYKAIILETGLNQPEAIALYQRSGYLSIGKFGKYLESPNSICFKKILI